VGIVKGMRGRSVEGKLGEKLEGKRVAGINQMTWVCRRADVIDPHRHHY
jgi:hypothetical protein